MEVSNHYWFKYKSLENEIIELTDKIHFSDGQSCVYSFYIADLILQIASEYESIINDLYIFHFDKNVSSTGKRLLALSEKLQLKKKKIMVTHQNMYFTKRFSGYFRPFNYRDEGANDIYKIYNAIKHHRLRNIKKATIKNLLLVLSALYILTVYYYGTVRDDLGLYESSIFTLKVAGVSIGIMMDFRVGVSNELDASVLFEQVKFDYYLFRETHNQDIKKVIRDCRRAVGKERLIEIIKQKQGDLEGIILAMLNASNPRLSIGELLNETARLLGNYFNDNSSYLLRVNLGYKGIYIPENAMFKPYRDVKEYNIADIRRRHSILNSRQE